MWRIFNLTADAHPIHFHLANAQVVSRQPFNVKRYTGLNPSFTGNPGVSPRTGGCEYVWHCHILEHEEHDMMRPLIVG